MVLQVVRRLSPDSLRVLQHEVAVFGIAPILWTGEALLRDDLVKNSRTKKSSTVAKHIAGAAGFARLREPRLKTMQAQDETTTRVRRTLVELVFFF